MTFQFDLYNFSIILLALTCPTNSSFPGRYRCGETRGYEPGQGLGQPSQQRRHQATGGDGGERLPGLVSPFPCSLCIIFFLNEETTYC